MEPSPTAAPLTLSGIEDLRPVGRGGFATVYRGWQRDLQRDVAVKVLDVTSSDAVRRFEREIRAMVALSGHPNVVPIYDGGSVAGRPYLVMPFLTGGSLADRLANGPLEPSFVVTVGRAVAAALVAAHDASMLHRDVKPANVLFSAYGEPQLTDFGIAKFADATVTQGQLVATITYAAPEVLAGQPATASSDVYSLGATLHAAIRGRAPYEARSEEVPMALAVRILAEAPADLRAAGAPTELAAVIERAMSKEPAARFASAADLLAALGATTEEPKRDPERTPAATDVVVPSPPLRTPAPQGPQRRRMPVGWVAAAAAVVIVALAVAMLARNATSGGDTASPTANSVAAPVGGSIEATVRDYYALINEGRLDDGFARLSPAYQNRTGKASYQGFWRTISKVEVVSVTPGDRSASLQLRYTRRDGSVTTEGGLMRFTEAGDGTLLIDDLQPA